MNGFPSGGGGGGEIEKISSTANNLTDIEGNAQATCPIERDYRFTFNLSNGHILAASSRSNYNTMGLFLYKNGIWSNPYGKGYYYSYCLETPRYCVLWGHGGEGMIVYQKSNSKVTQIDTNIPIHKDVAIVRPNGTIVYWSEKVGMRTINAAGSVATTFASTDIIDDGAIRFLNNGILFGAGNANYRTIKYVTYAGKLTNNIYVGSVPLFFGSGITTDFGAFNVSEKGIYIFRENTQTATLMSSGLFQRLQNYSFLYGKDFFIAVGRYIDGSRGAFCYKHSANTMRSYTGYSFSKILYNEYDNCVLCYNDMGVESGFNDISAIVFSITDNAFRTLVNQSSVDKNNLRAYVVKGFGFFLTGRTGSIQIMKKDGYNDTINMTGLGHDYRSNFEIKEMIDEGRCLIGQAYSTTDYGIYLFQYSDSTIKDLYAQYKDGTGYRFFIETNRGIFIASDSAETIYYYKKGSNGDLKKVSYKSTIESVNENWSKRFVLLGSNLIIDKKTDIVFDFNGKLYFKGN